MAEKSCAMHVAAKRRIAGVARTARVPVNDDDDGKKSDMVVAEYGTLELSVIMSYCGGGNSRRPELYFPWMRRWRDR